MDFNAEPASARTLRNFVSLSHKNEKRTWIYQFNEQNAGFICIKDACKTYSPCHPLAHRPMLLLSPLLLSVVHRRSQNSILRRIRRNAAFSISLREYAQTRVNSRDKIRRSGCNDFRLKTRCWSNGSNEQTHAKVDLMQTR